MSIAILGSGSRKAAAARFCGVLAVSTAAAVGLVAGPAGAVEFGNSSFLGVLSAQPPTGYPVSPGAFDLSRGPVTTTVSVAVTNLTSSPQTVSMRFAVNHILTYQGVDISDGQPGQAGISFPRGAAPQTTQTSYTPVKTGTFTVPASGRGVISFPMTIAHCGYYQVDFNTFTATGKALLAGGFTRALNCNKALAPRLTPGYWKNHQAATTALLPQKLGNYTVSTFTQARAVFDAMKCNAPANCLAAHLLAAKLDIASGASICIASTVAQADALLAEVKWAGPGAYSLTSAQSSRALELERLVDAYTNDSTSDTC